MKEPEAASAADAATTPPEDLAPTAAEIEAWAAREKARREAWLSGPTDEERAEYAQHVRQRRLADTFDIGEQKLENGVRQGLRYGREGQLAAEGAAYLLYRWSRRTFNDLVRAGRDWEHETALPNRRRRISLDDDAE
jgi:hypothetical protein